MRRAHREIANASSGRIARGGPAVLVAPRPVAEPSLEGNDMAHGTCCIKDCGMPVDRRGWCRKHYMRWQRHGDPFKGRPTAAERILPRIDIGHPLGCWQWLGGIDSNGYGRVSVNGKSVPAHRWVYEFFLGPIPDGLVLDHLCRNTTCVNPDHLEPVTNYENLRRGIGVRGVWRPERRACSHGHPLTAANTSRSRKGYRRCKECRRMAAAARRTRGKL